MARPSAKPTNTITLERVTGIIDRGADVKIPFVVFDYEVPVIEELYGAQSVSIISSEDVEVDADDFKAVDAHASLLNKYSQHEDSVKAVYPRVRTLARESGLSYDRADEAKAKFNQSQELVGGKAVASRTTSRAGSEGVESDDEAAAREAREDRLQAQRLADAQSGNGGKGSGSAES